MAIGLAVHVPHDRFRRAWDPAIEAVTTVPSGTAIEVLAAPGRSGPHRADPGRSGPIRADPSR